MKAKILQKSLIVTGMLSGLVSFSGQSAEEVMTFSFETIPDVSIEQLQALDFGDNLAVNAGSKCTLLVDGTAHPSPLDAKMGWDVAGTQGDAGTGFQVRSEDCDPTSSTTGTAGIYTITGAGGQEVSVTLNPITAAADIDFTFAPTGTVVNNPDDAKADATDFIGLANADAGVARLPSADDPAATVGNPIPGQTYVYVGGTLTAQRALDAGRTYDTQTFIIDVVYN